MSHAKEQCLLHRVAVLILVLMNQYLTTTIELSYNYRVVLEYNFLYSY